MLESNNFLISSFAAQDALERIRKTIQLDPKLPWTETLAVSYPEAHTVDHEDDLNRELALCVYLPFAGFRPN